MNEELANALASLKGIAGSGNILQYTVSKLENFVLTLEPGDFVHSESKIKTTAPIGYDLWYLFTNANMMANYYINSSGIFNYNSGTGNGDDANHFDYNPYLTTNLAFLTVLPGLKPLKTLRDLRHQLQADTYFDAYSMTIKNDWTNNGIYWINLAAFELWSPDQGVQYPSRGSLGYRNSPNDYVGYISIPIGQIGAQEVISLIQETNLSGYQFAAVDTDPLYWPKLPATFNSPVPGQTILQDSDKPTVQATPLIFPDMKDSHGGQLAGKNYCYGRHMIESGYAIPKTPVPAQNILNSRGSGAYAPTASFDVELFSTKIKDYPEDVRPKLWMRYWIHRDSTLPVPGEFIGFLCRPVAAPPHVWWFQESAPFIYAGNWIETGNLTSGIVTKVILEADRTDNGIGNQYYVKIQGCEVIIVSTDFFSYSVGDRVAILKLDTTAAPLATSTTLLNQSTLKNTQKGTNLTNYIIMPATFYKIKQ